MSIHMQNQVTALQRRCDDLEDALAMTRARLADLEQRMPKSNRGGARPGAGRPPKSKVEAAGAVA